MTPFDQTDIPSQCFGGPQGGADSHEMTSNALMLFYDKSKLSCVDGGPKSSQGEEEEKLQDVTESLTSNQRNKIKTRMVNGYEAYLPEIGQSNLLHTLHSYLLDTELHKSLLKLATSYVPVFERRKGEGGDLSATVRDTKQDTSSQEEILLHSDLAGTRLLVEFYVNVILRCRDLVQTVGKRWNEGVGHVFHSNPATACWPLGHVLDPNTSTWFEDFFYKCKDARSLQAFVNLLVSATAVLVTQLHQSKRFGR